MLGRGYGREAAEYQGAESLCATPGWGDGKVMFSEQAFGKLMRQTAMRRRRVEQAVSSRITGPFAKEKKVEDRKKKV